MIRKNFSRFLQDESGAVTVDWVVLTAAIVGLAASAALVVGPGMSALSTQISSVVGAIEISLDGPPPVE